MKLDIYDVMMSNSMTEYPVLVYILNYELLDHETWSANRHNQGQYF